MQQGRASKTIFLTCISICILWTQSTVVQAQEPESSVICPGWTVVGSFDPELSDVEKRLVCGDTHPDPSYPGKISQEAWRNIPRAQAEYHFKNFLQERGYHFPEFARPEFEGGIDLGKVYLGPLSRVKRVELNGSANEVDISKRRKILGEALTPSLLTTLEKWTFERLRRMGYGCPLVKSDANPRTGEVRVNVIPGKKQNIISVDQEKIPETMPNALRRYDAFSIGDSFDGSLLTLSENRATSSAIVETNHFIANCEEDGIRLRQTVLPGAPHLLIAGMGLNTEGVLLGRATWKNTRMGRSASSTEIAALGSSKFQTISNQWKWYFLPEVSHIHFNPVLRFTHHNENYYEDFLARVQFTAATSHDFKIMNSQLSFGPVLDVFRVERGAGAPNSKFLSLESRIELKSHDFEYYASDPREGMNLVLSTNLSHRNLYSDLTLQRVSLTGQSIWNLMNVDPPLWILGFRGGVSTVLTSEDSGPSTQIPAGLLNYLGGSKDIRGFGRQELSTQSGVGGLTSFFLGAELRLSHTLHARIDPFVFGDIGSLGMRSVTFDSPIYWSPGVGVRWASPIGPLRTTVARGFSNSISRHWQFYLSLGEEF